MQQSTNFIKGLSLLLIANGIIKPIWIFGIDAAVQNEVGNYYYGQYYSTLNLVLICNIILDFGLTNYWAATNNTKTAIPITAFYKTKLLFSLLYGIIVCCIALLCKVPLVMVLVPLVLLQIGNSFIIFYRNSMQTNDKLKTNTLFSVLDRVLAGLFILCILLMPNFLFPVTTTIYAWTQAIAILVSNIVAHLIIFPKQKEQEKFSLQQLITIVKAAFPFATVILLMTIVLRADVFFIKHLHANGYEEVAEYVYGFRFFDALNNFGYMIAGYAFVEFCKHIQNKEHLQKTSKLLSQFLIATIVVVLLVALLCNDRITELLYHKNNTKTLVLMYLCILAFLGCGLVHVYSSLLTASLHIKELIGITIGCILLMSVLHIIITPTYGAVGAALITAITQIVFGVSCFICCKRKKII